MTVCLQSEPFDVAHELKLLVGDEVGAVASFVGHVRGTGGLVELFLEHHERLTPAGLAAVEQDTMRRWALCGLTIIHRVGALVPDDAIVLVAASSAHRADAFAAVEFAIDRLKTEVPLWKRERFANGEARWVEPRDDDAERAARWG